MGMKLSEGMLWERVDTEMDRARDDAFSHGAGWLMVDQNGKLRRVSPSDVVAWALRQAESR